ncbi:hypothetical protein [Nocardia carnea]|uniref:Uncharacterized protein n=1 Tax=Nocardia carnea TaxID=37328 RepID=A0ABW7TNN2_9NOCA|nr:hypothetical protein [Nocardia carnea]
MSDGKLRAAAVALIRLDIPARGIDLGELAARHGYRLVYAVKTDTSPLLAIYALARHAAETGAEAVVVPSFEHADDLRHLITENAALITPMQLYPRGYRWPGMSFERGQS